MRIEIACKPFELTPALAEYTREQVNMALSRFASRLNVAKVVLEDVNGPRGGIDKRCKMEVRLNHGAEVVVETWDVDGYSAIRRTATRLARAVGRKVDRMTSNDRKLVVPERPDELVDLAS